MPTPNAALANDAAQAVLDALAGGVVEVYDGATLLAEVTLPTPAGSAAGGVITWDFDPDRSDPSINNTGTADSARIRDADASHVLNLTVGTSGADLILDTLSFTAGGTFTIQSLTTTIPSA